MYLAGVFIMRTEEFTQRILIVGLVAVSFVLAFLLVSQIYPTLLLAFTCWVLAIALNMVVDQLRARGMRRGIAIGLTLGGVILLAMLFMVLVVPSFVRQAGSLVSQLPTAINNAVRNYAAFQSTNPIAQRILPTIDPADLTRTLDALLPSSAAGGAVAPLDVVGLLGSATSTLVAVGSVLGGALLQIVLVVLITLFLMVDPTFFERLIVGVVPPHAEERTVEILNEVRRTVRLWVGAMFISISVTSLLYWVALGLVLGLPNAVALSIVGGIATIVPTIGPTIAIIPVIIFALAAGPAKLVAAVILYMAVGTVQDRIITPTVMKSELNIPPAGLVLFQLVAAALLGFVGLLIAVPLLAVLSTLVHEILVKDILGKTGGAPQVSERNGELVIEGREAEAGAQAEAEGEQA
jgi:predicted PurR-regulated permease PerM